MNIFLKRVFLGILITLTLLIGSSQASEEMRSTSTNLESIQVSRPFPTQLATPVNIGVSMVVQKISKLNESDGSFSAVVDLILRWMDPSLAFDPIQEGSDRIQLNGAEATQYLSKIWHPNVEISNLAGDPERHEDGVLVYPDGTIKYNQRISGVFRHNFNLSNFPFDKQNLPITLTSSYDVNKVQFVHDQVDVDESRLRIDGIQLPGWKPVKDLQFSINRELGWDKSYHSQINAVIGVVRNSKNFLPGVYFPFVLVMLVPMVISLWATDLKIDDSLNAWAGSILTLLALVFTVAIQYPLLQPDNIFYTTFWTGFSFQLIMLLLIGTLYNPSVRARLGNNYILEEVASVCRWLMPLGLTIILGRMLTLSIYAYSA